ncbi:MAG: Type 1 glutamine amidotransferase-like domain-containing protein [Ignavibacteriales bacterium]|nr:Type 1 glutamine amidotransferase-like domain-containing protein [Ignavibacteriales bacterium]
MKLISKIIFLFILFYNLTLNLNAQGYVCAIGGGSEDYNDWSDAPYSWVVQKSDSGKIIILGASSATEWLPTYFISFGADTAYNKTIATIAAANLQETYDELVTARAIFIRGGDQWDYIRLWKGTKVDSAINFVFENGGVIAGTSAGAAVLGDVDFSAQSGSAYPDEALQNPFYNRMKFENNFLNLIPNVLFDTHFIERARHGRLIAMIYNQHYNASRDLIGAGIDDRTAICISPDGIGEVMGSGAVSIFYKDALTKYSSINSGKYTIENLKSHLLTKGWKYDFVNNVISFVPSSARDVDPNRTWFYPQTNFYLTGSNDLTSHLANLNAFLTENNNSNILVISHPGFSNSLTTITNFLSNINITFDVVNITTSSLNNSEDAIKINQATSFIFAGDSLNVLSYLNQPIGLVNSAFYNSLGQHIPVFFFGNTGKIAGHYFIGNTDSDLYAGYRGKMTLNEGLFIFPELVFQPLIFENSDFYENRMSAVLWGMMRNNKRVGVYLNGNDRLKITPLENSICGNVQIPYIIIDARETTKVDSSTYRASGSIGPRQIVAMNDVRFSITNYPDIKYLIESGVFDNLTEVENNNSNSLPSNFVLNQNYPNPFNPSTTISFSIPTSPLNPSTYNRDGNGERLTSLIVYDILGSKIVTLFNKEINSGFYEVEFNGSKLSSGIYFYRLFTQNFSLTKSMVLLR